jgi:hypothetical protein
MTKILIASCGYELRSSQFARAEKLDSYDKIFIIDYASEGIHSYDRNKADLLDLLPSSRTTWIVSSHLNKLLNALAPSVSSPVFLDVDCSSMDRSTLAIVLANVKTSSDNFESLNMIYFPQTYSAPALNLETVSRFGPIARQFSGSSRSSSERMCLVMGVGYEFGKAIGAQDYLEPDELYAFYPTGTDPEFEKAILKANSNFDFVGDMEKVITYPLLDPTALLDNLLTLIDFKRQSHRVMLLPMGPKIFAALCLVVALRFHPDVRVWRYSTEDPSKSHVKEAYPSGERVSFDVLKAMAPGKAST